MFELHLMWNYTYDEKETEVQHIFDVYTLMINCSIVSVVITELMTPIKI